MGSISLHNRSTPPAFKFLLQCLVLSVCLVVHLGLYGQKREADSLEWLLNRSTGMTRIKLLSELSMCYHQVNPDKGIAYAGQAIRMADSLKAPSAKSSALNNMGANYLMMSEIDKARSYFFMARANALRFNDSLEFGIAAGRLGVLCDMQGKYDSALTYMKEEFAIFRNLNIPDKIGKSLENQGTVHMNRGELKSALACFLDAEKQYLKAGAAKSLPYLFLKLGRVYAETKDPEEAIKWYKKGIRESLRIGDNYRAGIGLNAIGILCFKSGSYDSAMAYYNQALNLVNTMPDQRLVAAIYGNMGNVFENQGLHLKAYNYHEKALRIAEALKSRIVIAQEKTGMGKACQKMGDYTKARKLFEEALPVFKESKSNANLLIIYENLIDINNQRGNFALSVAYYKEYIALKDSLNLYERNNSLDSLKVLFKTEQTRNENIVLSKENQLQLKTISLQRVLILSAIAGTILMILVVILVIRNRTRMKHANRLLSARNEEITAQREEMVILNQKLSELSKFKDSMNSFLVHDLKNLLNAMMHYGTTGHTLQNEEAFRHSAGQMLTIISNILDISKYESHSMVLSITDGSLRVIVDQAFRETLFLATKKDIGIVFKASVDYWVSADGEIVKRVFVNLLTNAIKYSPASREISIRAERDASDHIRIEVQDQGQGIDPHFVPHVFEKFSQADPRPSGHAASTGIGLAFCKLAVESMGGTIGVISVPGEGTTVWFTLPAAARQADLQPVEVVSAKNDWAADHLSPEEKNRLKHACTLMQQLNIYCISDVKDIVNAIADDSTGIREWKMQLFNALSNCNEASFNQLIRICGEESV